MQRKNSLLMKPVKKLHKSGMAMIMAIAVLVIISTIMALSLALSSQTTKRTTDLYLYEQAAILSHSAAEYAMLKMSQANPCSLTALNYSYNNTYDINTTMKYIPLAGSTCATNAGVANILGTTTYPASDGTVVLDVTVSTKAGIAAEPVRYFRRTIQKL